ncbi:MAG: globin [Planctomycetaceae bacterium]
MDHQDDDNAIVRQSFGRCTLTDQFLVTFYEILTGSSDEIRILFAHTDMPRQRKLLKEGLIYLISYPTGNEFARTRVTELGISHSRTRLNVRQEFYQNWIDSLMNAIQRHDSSYSSDLDAAWRRVLAPGIAAMMALYDQPPAVA